MFNEYDFHMEIRQPFSLFLREFWKVVFMIFLAFPLAWPVYYLLYVYMYKCISIKWTGIRLDDGLSPIRHQDIIWTNAEILSDGPLARTETKFQSKRNNFRPRKLI